MCLISIDRLRCGICVDDDNTVWVALNDLYRIGTYENGIVYARQAIQYFENSQWQVKKLSTQSQISDGGNFYFYPDDILHGSFDVVYSGLYTYVKSDFEGSFAKLYVLDDAVGGPNGIIINGIQGFPYFRLVTIEKKENKSINIWGYFNDLNYEMIYSEYVVDAVSGKLISPNEWKTLTSL